MLGVYDKMGSLSWKNCQLFHYIRTCFAEKTVLLQNWTQGIKYAVKEESWYDVKGMYNFIANTPCRCKSFYRLI